MTKGKYRGDEPIFVARAFATATVFAGIFIPASIAITLALAGFALFPLLGPEALIPFQDFLTACVNQLLGPLLALGTVTGLMYAVALFGNKLDKAESVSLPSEPRMFGWALRLCSPANSLLFQKCRPDCDIPCNWTSSFPVLPTFGLATLINSVGITTVARRLQ